jgi:hypothetical protein
MTPKDGDHIPEPDARQRRDAVLKHMLGRAPEKHEPLGAKKTRRRTVRKKKASSS